MAKTVETDVRIHRGSVLEIHGHHVGEPARLAEILEVLGDADHPRYRLRWDDGRESIVYPSSDARVRPKHEKRRR